MPRACPTAGLIAPSGQQTGAGTQEGASEPAGAKLLVNMEVAETATLPLPSPPQATEMVSDGDHLVIWTPIRAARAVLTLRTRSNCKAAGFTLLTLGNATPSSVDTSK